MLETYRLEILTPEGVYIRHVVELETFSFRKHSEPEQARAGLKVVCERIAAALGGELTGVELLDCAP